MKIRTLDDLSRNIRDDLGWRRKETLVFQGAVRRSEAGKKQALLRGAVATLYAHWEGFVKASCRVYLEYVRTRRLLNKQLAVPLLALALRRKLASLSSASQLDSHRQFFEWLLLEWDRRSNLPDPDDVITTSNLNADVFRSIICGLGLPYRDDYRRAEKPVIDSLIELRNHLAHGEWQIVEETAYDQYFVWVHELMRLLCDSIEDAAITSRFKRAMNELD